MRGVLCGAGVRGKGKPALSIGQGRPGVEVRVGVDRGKNNQGRSGVKVQGRPGVEVRVG